jgi:Mg2+/Co2+ transporter CorB
LENIPFWLQLAAIVVLLMMSAFFSISETSMMALNRFRLGHLVRQGKSGARVASDLLAKTDRLLGTILLGNNLVNTLLTALVTALAIRTFGDDDRTILAATTVVAFLIIIFAEITPKIIGAAHPERIALPASFVLRALMGLFSPIVWLLNLMVGRMLRAAGVDTSQPASNQLSLEEMRSIVLESGHFIPEKHRSILLNLFDLERITVDDVMIPRSKIEAIDITLEPRQLRERLSTCYHNKLPVCEGEINKVVGMLHVRRALALLQREQFESDDLRSILSEPYYIPSGTAVFAQLQLFQRNRQRTALVVDEYGEVQGLVTLEDIIEEIIGEFTTSVPGGSDGELDWNEAGEVVVEGSTLLRDLNRRLGTSFSLEGPKTLNGMILEALRDLPEASISVRFDQVVVEVLQVENRMVRSARLRQLRAPDPQPEDAESLA